jgi:CubicO group peptidase (beta-lactamase class C family)
MIRYALTSVFAALLCLAGPVRAADLAPVLAKAMDGTRVPAMGVLLIRDRKVDGEAVRGVRRIDQPNPVTADDVWHIGSDGKAMTVTMIGRLVDRGVLSWSTPLSQMLPDLAQTMQPQYRAVTLEQLLSHHSGLPHDLTGADSLIWSIARTRTTLTRQRLTYIAKALQEPPVGPTSAFNYSNTGLIVAAAVAERATGTSYEDLMRKEVFAPLGMSHVGFGVTHPGQPMGHLDGRPAKPEDGNPDFFAPAGNMYMPLGDWARFCIDQLDGAAGQGRLLKPETYRMMQTDRFGDGVALGWGTKASLAGRRGPVLVHAGSDGTWYAVVALFPAAGSGVLVTANAGESMGAKAAVESVVGSVVADLSPPAK